MLDKGKISAFQIGLLLYPSVLTSGFLALPSTTYQLARNDLWLTSVPAVLIGLLTVYLATRLHALYPNQTIVQYGERILGKVPGKLLGGFYIFLYLHAVGGITREYAEFIVGNFLMKTPVLLVMSSMLLLCAIAVRGGVEILARGGVLFFPLFVLPLLFLLLLIPEIEFANVLPVLNHGWTPVAKGSLPIMAWTTELFLISFFLPYMSDLHKARRFGFQAAFGVVALLTYVNLIAFLLLGPDLGNKIYPLLIAFRYVNIGFFLENLESFVLIMWVIGHFLQVGVFLYAAAISFANCFQLSDYRPVVYPIAILGLAIGLWDLPNLPVFNEMVRTAVPFHILSMHLVVPLFLLLVAVIRKRSQAPL